MKKSMNMRLDYSVCVCAHMYNILLDSYMQLCIYMYKNILIYIDLRFNFIIL